MDKDTFYSHFSCPFVFILLAAYSYQKQPNMIKAFVQAVIEHLFNSETGDTVLSLFGGISSSILISNHTFFANLALNCITWLAAGIFGAIGALLAKSLVKTVANYLKTKRNETPEK